MASAEKGTDVAFDSRPIVARRLPLRTVVSLAIAAVVAIVFLEIADRVLSGGTNDFDRAVSLGVHGFDSDAMDRVMRTFTVIGEVRTILIAAVVMIVVLVRQRARSLAFLLGGVVTAALLMNWVLKTQFHRARPDLFFEIVAPLSYSFPSGHALISSASYGAMAIVLARLVPKLRTAIFTLTALVVFAIGLSRIYLGVHWATDVMAGFAVGGFLLVAFEFVAARIREPAVVSGTKQ